MKYLYLNKQIAMDGEDDSMSVIAMIESIQKMINEGEKNVTIFINSPGGEAAATFILIEFINSIKDKIDIHLVAVNSIASAGVILLFESDVKSKTVVSCRATIHLGDIGVSLKENRVKFTSSSALSEVYDEFCESTIAMYKAWGFSKEEMKHIKAGYDCTINAGRLRELVNGFKPKGVFCTLMNKSNF